MLAKLQAAAVNAVKADHSTTMALSMRRGPKRSASIPEGV